MKLLNKEEIKEIIKILKRKFNVEDVEYLEYNRFAIIESHRKPVDNEGMIIYPKIRKYRLVDEKGNIINLKNDYNFITKFTQGVATVIIRENPQIIEDSTGLKATERNTEGLIDTNGYELLPCIYDSVIVHLDGFIELKKDGITKATNVNKIVSDKFNWDTTI